MAFSPEGSQPQAPFLPGSLVDARLGFHMCKASEPFSGSGSRSSSSTHTGPGKSSDPQSLASLTPAKSNTGGLLRPSAELGLGAASSPGSALGYLRTSSLPHVPTHPLLAPGLSPQSETPAMANPRECPPSVYFHWLESTHSRCINPQAWLSRVGMQACALNAVAVLFMVFLLRVDLMTVCCILGLLPGCPGPVMHECKLFPHCCNPPRWHIHYVYLSMLPGIVLASSAAQALR